MSKICEVEGINAWKVIELCNKHPRVNIHQPGPGVGGHCLAVDPWFIIERNKETAKIIEYARKTNDSMPHHVFKRIETILGSLSKKVITILGVTYKQDIDDMRESPVLELIKLLKRAGCEIRIFDPYVDNTEHIVGNIIDACADSDMLVLAVNHSQFKELDFKGIYGVMNSKNIFDCRNYFSKDKLKEAGFNYYLLGDSCVY